MDLGGRPFQVTWDITLPIIAPAMVSGWLLAFTLSLDDLDGNGHQADLAESPTQMFDMEGSELVDKLKVALKKIPYEQRTVFILRVNDGLSYQEISETMDISMGTVMSRLSRARDKLRILLEEYVKTNDIEV